MKTLTALEVKNKLSISPETMLVMTLGPEAFKKCHIPGSLNISDIETALQRLNKDDQIIVYCSDKQCLASYFAYQQLEQNGFQNIWRFAGGLLEWTENGFPIENG